MAFQGYVQEGEEIMEFAVDVRKNKSVAKCRVCRKNISVDSLCVFTIGKDNFNTFQAVVHANCLLLKIVHESKKIRLSQLRVETDAFAKLEEVLR